MYHKWTRSLQKVSVQQFNRVQRTLRQTANKVLKATADVVTPVPDVIGVTRYTRFVQLDSHSCYARCVQSILWHHQKVVPYMLIKRALKTSEDGTSETHVIRYLRQRGFVVGVRDTLSLRQIKQALQQQKLAVVHVDTDHVAVVHAIDDKYVYLMDPSVTRMPGRRLTHKMFRRRFDRMGILVSR